jgi:NAD(P)-dependent dehydrogenase (short-subunit alcohol dehydrogenase family)
VWFRKSIPLQTCGVISLLIAIRGIIDTPMLQNSPKAFIQRLEAAVAGLPLGRKGIKDEVADFTVCLLGDETSYITGQVLHVDGGILA